MSKLKADLIRETAERRKTLGGLCCSALLSVAGYEYERAFQDLFRPDCNSSGKGWIFEDNNETEYPQETSLYDFPLVRDLALLLFAEIVERGDHL